MFSKKAMNKQCKEKGSHREEGKREKKDWRSVFPHSAMLTSLQKQ